MEEKEYNRLIFEKSDIHEIISKFDETDDYDQLVSDIQEFGNKRFEEGKQAILKELNDKLNE